jgi:hypothetical protein
MINLYSRDILKLFGITIAIILAVLAALDLLLISLLILASVAISFAINRINLRYIGIELVMFAAVITGFVYGPVAGAFTGAILMIFHLSMGQYIGPYVLWVVPAYGAAGFLAGSFDIPIATLGMYITILVNAVEIFFTLAFNRAFIVQFSVWSFTNIAFNLILFRTLSEIAIAMA